MYSNWIAAIHGQCCSSTTGEFQGGQPTLVECVRFQGRDRRINISQEIGTKYITFGTVLLEGRTGERVSAIAHKHMHNSEQTSMEILEEWIAGRGKQPVTWNTLIEVLHDIELCTLAREVAAVKLPEGEYLEVMLLEHEDSDADSEGSVGEDSDQSDGGEIPAELIELSTLATEIEAVKRPLEDRPAEDTVDSNERTVGDVCTGIGVDSDQSDGGEIPAELIEDYRHEDSVNITEDLLTKYFETMLLECRDPDADSEGTVGEDSDQSGSGEIPAELIEDFRHENSEGMFQECEDSEQKVATQFADCKGSEPTRDIKPAELQHNGDPVPSLIFEDTLDGDVETTKSDVLACSQDSEQEQEDEADSVSCDIDRTGNSFIEDVCLD